MTILKNLNLQPIDDDLSLNNSWSSDFQLHEAIDVAQLDHFLDEAVKDMRRNPIWDTNLEKGNK